MKKTLLTTISIICIIAFNVGLTGCASIKDKSDISENHPTTMSKTNGTSIPNSSTAPATVMPTQTSSSPSVNSIDAIDYSQYIKKVWVIKNWTNEANNSSFSISKIENGKIEGKFSTLVISVPDYYYYLPDHLGYLGSLTGTINNGIAEGKFNDKNGDKGNIKLVFKSNDEIEATINYTEKSQNSKEKSLDGTFLFRPYNLKDIDGFNPFKDQCFSVDLNSWGNVKFASGKIMGGSHIPTVAYLTNKEDDILYDFTWAIPNNVDFYAVSLQDVNKDGLKDIIIIYGVDDDISSSTAKIFTQNTDGVFDVDGDMTQEINDSGNNKDIKTVLDYLSKKF
ncbi:hypothetical protein SAMN04487970_10022 [Paenibacillus tianmuensis]|uniref:Uncharacterized protein n=1 Tax=Paenibacillus tianmuensis TaxID=624147 RepID=A0A1G4PCG6_9BACL|nr:hypothetical protein [Paenibacillus tianmuensis]SCW29910.1 hypothetical protein SAMN04487970_10022 [Paenibacillus tianmuensis]